MEVNSHNPKSKEILREQGKYEPYVYVIKNTQDGRLYIGSRTSKRTKDIDLGKRYFTSSNYIKDEWRKNPSLYDIVEVIPCESNHKALELELDLIESSNAVYDDAYINRGSPYIGFNTSGIPFSEEKRKKYSLYFTGKWVGENHPMYGKKHTEETKMKISESLKGEKNPNYGKKFSAERIAQMAEISRGKKASKETRRKMSEAQKGERNHNFGKKMPKHQCPHCGKSVAKSMLVRWHGDKCKHKEQ